MSASVTSYPAYCTQNKARVVQGGKEYFTLLLSLIARATQSVHLQTYIFDDDETGTMIADALKAAAKRNVAVFLLADGYASQVMSKVFIKQLRDAGIQFRFFEPLLKSKHFYFGRRLHHKIAVIDANYSLVGGINITNRYNDMPEKKTWLDFALYVEGEIATQLYELCWKMWYGSPLKMNSITYRTTYPAIEPNIAAPVNIRMSQNDWIRRKNEISATYIEMLRHSRSHITILCSYFLPGKVIRRLLTNAIRRGIKIKVITAGPSDVMWAKHAERWLYDWLLRNKIELYEYQTAILHGKVAVCDTEWFTLGSYNINNISAYASIELNLDVRNITLATEMEKTLETIIEKECIAITPKQRLKSRNLLKQFLQWASYQTIRVVFYLCTFYFKRPLLAKSS